MLDGGAGNDRLLGEKQDDHFDLVSAQVYRLYRATLGREPEEDGARYHTRQVLSGTSNLTHQSSEFYQSTEFQARCGATSNAQFVTLLYNNVLGRAPETAGLDYWSGKLDTGSMSRSQALLGFSESAEFISATETSSLLFSHAGRQAVWSDDVFRLYKVALGREPELAGMTYWSWVLGGGTNLVDATQSFVTSPEFLWRYGDKTNADFVSLLYHNMRGQEPEPAGFQYWNYILDCSKMTRPQVVQEFSQSVEFKYTSAPALKEWMRSQGADDILTSGGGNDVLFGGILSDTFVFDASHTGQSRVVDLEPWDRIALSGFDYDDPVEALSHFTQVGDTVVFADLDVSVIFDHTMLSNVTPDMLHLTL